MSTVSGLDIANKVEQEWRDKCQKYIDIHDAVVRDNDRLYELLSRCEVGKGYKQAMKDVIELLMAQHEAAKGSHNYWHVAANFVKAEFLSEEKNT